MPSENHRRRKREKRERRREEEKGAPPADDTPDAPAIGPPAHLSAEGKLAWKASYGCTLFVLVVGGLVAFQLFWNATVTRDFLEILQRLVGD